MLKNRVRKLEGKPKTDKDRIASATFWWRAGLIENPGLPKEPPTEWLNNFVDDGLTHEDRLKVICDQESELC